MTKHLDFDIEASDRPAITDVDHLWARIVEMIMEWEDACQPAAKLADDIVHLIADGRKPGS